MRLTLLITPAIGLLAGCGGTQPTTDDSMPSPSSMAEIRCGDVVLGQGELLEVAGAAERSCLEGALRDGRSATLTVTEPTVEGDPIVTAWRLMADGTLTAVIDSSRDRFGGEPRMTRVSCGRVTALPNPMSCASAG